METYYITVETVFGHTFTEYVDTEKGIETAKRIAESRTGGKAVKAINAKEA